jgi:hypothetical protein
MEIPEASISCHAVSASSLRCEANFLVPIPKERSAPGLGRVKTVSQGRRTWEPGPRCVSGHNRSHQRLGADDVHDPCQIIGEDRESHLGGYFWKRFGEEVCCPHAGLHRAERMLDCLSTLAHGLWV